MGEHLHRNVNLHVHYQTLHPQKNVGMGDECRGAQKRGMNKFVPLIINHFPRIKMVPLIKKPPGPNPKFSEYIFKRGQYIL